MRSFHCMPESSAATTSSASRALMLCILRAGHPAAAGAGAGGNAAGARQADRGGGRAHRFLLWRHAPPPVRCHRAAGCVFHYLLMLLGKFCAPGPAPAACAAACPLVPRSWSFSFVFYFRRSEQLLGTQQRMCSHSPLRWPKSKLAIERRGQQAPLLLCCRAV